MQVQQEPPQQPAYQQQAQEPPPSPWSQPQQQAAPPWSQPATQGPVCQHGAMEYKDFVSKAGNHVKGHFCTQRNSTCKPVYAPK